MPFLSKKKVKAGSERASVDPQERNEMKGECWTFVSEQRKG